MTESTLTTRERVADLTHRAGDFLTRNFDKPLRAAGLVGALALALTATKAGPAGATVSKEVGIGATSSAVLPNVEHAEAVAPDFSVMPFAPENRPDDKTGNLIKVMRLTCTPGAAHAPSNTFSANYITERINNVQDWYNQRLEGNRVLKFDNEGGGLDIMDVQLPAESIRADGSRGKISCDDFYRIGSFSTREVIDAFIDGRYSPSIKEKLGPNWDKYIYMVFMDMRMRDRDGANARPPTTPGRTAVVFSNQETLGNQEKLIASQLVFTMGLPNRIMPPGPRSTNPRDIIYIKDGVWSGTQYPFDQLLLDQEDNNYRRDIEEGFNAINRDGSLSGVMKLFSEKVAAIPPPKKNFNVSVGFNKLNGKPVKGTILGMGKRCVNSCLAVKQEGTVLRIDPVISKASRSLIKVVGFENCDRVINHRLYGKRCIETVNNSERIGIRTAPRQAGVAK
jgi:hypothetical protein